MCVGLCIGMLTFIICAPVAGLQIANRFPTAASTATTKPVAAPTTTPDSKTVADLATSENNEYGIEKTAVSNWLDVEKTSTVGVDLFVIAGRKCSLFAAGTCRGVALWVWPGRWLCWRDG